ncbi:hypothetical protein [Actinomadura madurae]|uniref:hypothetical protein n=1 Tax=Actinomadura madurae TaxID=1993 RepID=UPI0020D2322B|nr:hypothetical protein [Actinomadura madurae]MCP9948674.1 hypothetical protein [Actinomadura madurae]MCP9965445.1 hypothetical protein [Actinomadura madurae]MCP9977935.1 hypothetical protein [Actinomadura madurae]MCQ0010564.1 hypothetical protein [Actinomadura madurae]MCQ0014125.1 hypothetical protein [Actinomadura madurae]
MAITEKQVAVLRAQLTGQHDEHLRLAKQLEHDEANREYAALVAAAFIVAVERRFIADGEFADESEVIDFVAQVRAKSPDMPEVIDPRLAESLILHLLEKGPVLDADADTKFGHQIVLLAALAGDEQFTDSELEVFLSEVRPIAEDLLE